MQAKSWVGAAALGIVFAGGAHAQTKWDVVTGYPETSFHVKNLRQFAQELNEATGGQLQLTVHPGGSLVKAPDIRKAVTDGKAAVGEVFGPSMSAVHGVFGLDAIPFLATDYKSARSLWKQVEPMAARKLNDQGYTLLMSVPWPPQGIFSSRELKSVRDIEGLRMRENSPPVKRLAELAGAKPVRVETPDLATSAKAGNLDLVFTSAAQGLDTKLTETMPYFYQANAWLPRNFVFVSTAAYSKLTPQQQAAVQRTAGRAEERGWQLSEQSVKANMADLAKVGAKIAPLPDAVKTKLDRLGTQIARETLQQADPELMGLVFAYMK
ncbi:MAG: TRAP transporter substrate-binding protein [Burkholderiaceae bacterium]